MTAPRFVFPDGFHWGAATSAYQIEGSPLADGAGPSIWQRFAHTPGMMANGDTGDVACDHYRRYRQDVQLMKALGLDGYRFSINWARVLPEGTGRVNPKGLDFYSRLVDELLEHGIAPNATLFHWDLPAALDDRGGWLNRDSAHWFAEYAEVMFKALDDRVPRWSTLNEPWVVTDGGYLHGALAPGHRNKYEAPIAAHNLMRASGAGIQAYRAHGRHEIGVVFNIEPKYPYSEGATVDDPLRCDYLRKHLRALHAAIAAGVNVQGYYAWSLLDNLEWSLGYAKRFGLYHVDFATQQRTAKASAKLYAQVIASNGAVLDE